jgi:flagellar biogenesis protein FliO
MVLSLGLSERSSLWFLILFLFGLVLVVIGVCFLVRRLFMWGLVSCVGILGVVGSDSL